MTNEEVNDLVRLIRGKLLRGFYREIEDIAKPGRKKIGHKMVGIILASLMIDYLAGFFTGVTKQTMSSGSGERYKDFVKAYLPRYDPGSLWSDIRSRLVHNYSVGGSYGFTHMEQDGKHFEEVLHVDGKKRIVLNLEDFLKDVKKAVKKYLSDLKIDPDLQEKARRRRESLGLLRYIKPA